MSDREHTSMESDRLDALLEAHLRAELDGQLGGAEARFTREMAKQASCRRGGHGRLALWGLWAAGAMAASVGIVWGVVVSREAGLQAVTRIEPGVTTPAVSSSSADGPQELGEIVEYS